MQRKNCLRGAIPLLAAVLIAGCSSTRSAPNQAQISNELAVKATVVAVDKRSRELVLKRSDGTEVSVVAGPEVTSFDQIKLGDILNARYTVSLSARRLDPGEIAAEPAAGMAAARTKPGEKPGAAIGAGVTLTVIVISVDRDTHTVMVTYPDGNSENIQAQRENGKRFVDGLKPGDRVELTYGEALVLAVE